MEIDRKERERARGGRRGVGERKRERAGRAGVARREQSIRAERDYGTERLHGGRRRSRRGAVVAAAALRR